MKLISSASKTQLLLSEANNDPVRRADLIRDVVKSIAVIPEAITRTVYIKECSTVLEVSEPILYHEVNKLRQQKSFRTGINIPVRKIFLFLRRLLLNPFSMKQSHIILKKRS